MSDFPPVRHDSRHRPPKHIRECAAASAEDILRAARDSTATLWRGDFQQAKQILAAVKKRLHRPTAAVSAPADPAAAFHKHRLAQSQNSRLANMLLVEVGTDFAVNLPRAPDTAAAIAEALGESRADAPFLLPLNRLLGMTGAHEWHKKGVFLPELGGRIHVPFGVFSPLRGEYLALLRDAPLPRGCRTAFDIGTGSGVLAVLLAQRGVPRLAATDTNPRAVACARANVRRFGLSAQIDVLQTDLFPSGSADLIVCNPPWLPAKPTSDVETALYDPDSAMLDGLLRGAAAHLHAGGELWLVMSDLAVHLGLRGADELARRFAEHGWRVAGEHYARPQHAKAADRRDPLAFARMKERTALYRLQAA